MRAKLLTIRFSPQLGRFDDAPLLALQQKVVLEHLREHLVQVGQESMLVCLATWRERADAPAGTTPSLGSAETPSVGAAGTPAAELRAPPDKAADPVGAIRAEFSDEQQQLFDRLRAFRRERAHAEGAPPYVILTNRQLVELVRRRPNSRSALAEIAGLGDKKIQKLGSGLLALLWPATEQDADAVAPATAEVQA